MNLKEKRKEIKNLCKNLDEKIFATIKQRFPDNENSVYLDAGHLHAKFNIDDEKQYNRLIDFLKQHQKQPDLYTLDAIKEALKHWCAVDKYRDIVIRDIKKHAKPYKKID